jgi:hypothetical protein
VGTGRKVFFDLLNRGADVHGTIKRMDWVPAAYKRKHQSQPTGAALLLLMCFPNKPLQIRGWLQGHLSHGVDWKGRGHTTRKVDMFGFRIGLVAVSSKLCILRL